MAKRIVVAGGTGDLGTRIVKALVAQRGEVVALARKGSDEKKVKALKDAGAAVAMADLWNVEELSKVLHGATCVVS